MKTLSAIIVALVATASLSGVAEAGRHVKHPGQHHIDPELIHYIVMHHRRHHQPPCHNGPSHMFDPYIGGVVESCF